MEQRKTKQILKFHKILIKRFINEVKDTLLHVYENHNINTGCVLNMHS